MPAEQRRTLREEIQALPLDQQYVLSLYYEENLDFGEIARVLGISESLVRHLYIKAVTKVFS